MLWLLIIAVASGILLYQYFSRLHSITREGKRIRLAPDSLPLLGHGIQFLKPRHELFQWFTQCQRKYGLETLEISVPTLPSGVVISSPANLEFVLKNEHLVSKGDFVKSRSRDLFGNGIINASGELWKAQRKAGLKFFSGSNLDAMVELILPEAYSRMHTRLSKLAKDGTVVDMQSIFLDFTSFIMGHMAYDMNLDSSHPFSKAFDYASDRIGRRFQNPLYSVTEFFSSALQVALTEVKDFGQKIVARAKQRRSRTAFESLIDNEEPVFDTLIDSLLETFADAKIVADSALNFLSAGKDTTAQSFTWTLYALMRNPAALKSLQKMVKAHFLAHKSENGILKLSVADLQPSNVPLLLATYHEALRLYPPIPFEIQETQQDLTLPDGTFLPRNSVVVWCIWAMNRAEEIYGEDADTFRPERWLDKDGKFVGRSAFEFPVFNGGPRSCLGKKMAELMAVYLFLNVLSAFTFKEEVPRGASSSDRQAQNSLTLPMAGGLPCRVSQIN